MEQKNEKNKKMVLVVRPEYGYTGLLAKKIHRNYLCSCGSGKKAKKCCGCDTRYYNRQKK